MQSVFFCKILQRYKATIFTSKNRFGLTDIFSEIKNFEIKKNEFHIFKILQKILLGAVQISDDAFFWEFWDPPPSHTF